MDVEVLALACYRTPLAYKDRLTLNAPLPKGMDRLLGLANGSPEIMDSAVIKTGARPQELRDAARFCIQQWCLMRGANHHRVLGLNPGASPAQIKDHRRLLMRLLHPDRAVGRETWTESYAARINEAWTALSRSEFQGVRNTSPPLKPSVDLVIPNANVWQGKWATPTSRSEFSHTQRWLIAFRSWFLAAVLIGLGLVTIFILEGPFLFIHDQHPFPPVSDTPTVHDQDTLPAMPDHSAIASFLTEPDWQRLDRREWSFQLQITQDRQEWAKHHTAEQRWEQLQAEQEQSELLANNLHIERLERLKAELTSFGPDVMEPSAMIGLARTKRVASSTIETSSASEKSSELEIEALDDLINRYSKTYQQGDLDRLMMLFISQEHGRDANNWQRIRQHYANFFSTHMIREFKVHDLLWNIQGESASGIAHYQLSLRHRYGGGIQHIDGNIRFEVRKQDDQLLLNRVDQEIRAKSSSKALDDQTP